MSKKKHKTSIGGQAIYEGVMMKGPKFYSMAVRLPEGDIDVAINPVTSPKDKYPILKLPFLRGISGFIESLSLGYKTLAYSFEKSGMEEEPTKFEEWLSKKLGKSSMDIVIVLGSILGVLLSLGLFMLLPAAATSFSFSLIDSDIAIPSWYMSAFEGVIKIVIFILYLLAVSNISDIKRIFQYHGAEHKTIFAYEEGLPLTVENVREMKRFHPRCGTSFMIIVLIVSIVVFSLPIFTWTNVFVRFLTKMAFLPLIVGISYEFIRLAGKYDNVLTRLISAPGIFLQNITTKEPDDAQIEVAIAAMEKVIPERQEEALW